MEPGALQIVIVAGPDDADRAALGFASAAAAAAAGARVIVFLAMKGAYWALRSRAEAPLARHFPVVRECVEVVQAGGGRVEVCSNCLEGLCSAAPEGEGGALLEGILPGGISSLAIRMGQMRTVTF
jgi:predicted peroxiredoxin